METLRAQYDGYWLKGNMHNAVYNPYSVMCALDLAAQESPETVVDLSSYHPWLKTSVLDVLRTRLQHGMDIEIFVELVSGFFPDMPVIQKDTDDFETFQELTPASEKFKTIQKIKTLLVNTGFLSYAERPELGRNVGTLMIPNEEARVGLRWAFWEANGMSKTISNDTCTNVRQFLMNGNIDQAMLAFHGILTNFNFRQKLLSSEMAYNNVLYTFLLLCAEPNYSCSSQENAGRGILDILLEPKREYASVLFDAYILELKYFSKKQKQEEPATPTVKKRQRPDDAHEIHESMVRLAKEGLQQIYEKKSFNKIKTTTTCVFAGICFGEGRIVVVQEKRQMDIYSRELIANDSRVLTLTTFPNEDNENSKNLRSDSSLHYPLKKTATSTITNQASVVDVSFQE